jgi:hypothetical protein
MGILDDAIREHLDLKRRLGADDVELQKLEGEAFGPATRPGDPDFPEQPATGESPIGPDTVEAPFDAAAGPATDEEPVAQVPEATIEDAVEVAPEPPEPPHAPEPEPEPVAPEVEPSPEPPAAAAVEPEPQPVAAAPEPEPEVPLEEELPYAAVPLARELRAIVEPATGESAIRPEDELDLDLDLELDEPEPEPEPAATDPTPTPTQPEPPIESLDTVEHHIEDAIEDTGDIEVVEGEVAEEPATGEHAEAEKDKGDEDEDEDVLEETPEFLRDQPEDDELWFEQGSPKDFDF